jgi:RHS repeat-associated protein
VIAAGERQQSLNGVRFVAGDPGSVTIDPNGNLTQKVEGSTTWTYEWNAENQLKRVLQNGNEVARYAYDPLGRRVEKVAGGVTTTWTYDGEDILREISGSSTLKYVQGLGIDEALAIEDGTGVLTHNHFDGIGSIVKTTNSAGTVIVSRHYDAFGNIQIGPTASGVAYTARYFDSETGLYHYRARYYDPQAGRFLSQDPIGFWGGINFYAYVKNNPVKWTDPLGLAPQSAQCCAAAEERQIRKQMEDVRQRIDALVKTGTAVLPGGSNVSCAATTCTVFRIPGTNIFTASAQTEYQPGCQNLSPCIKHCVDMHEAVHRRMCKRLGLKFHTLTEYQSEYPAYMTELGCYIRTLREGGVNPYPD